MPPEALPIVQEPECVLAQVTITVPVAAPLTAVRFKSVWDGQKTVPDAVVVIDGAGTPGRGSAWEREVFHDLAAPVLADQVDGLRAVAAECGVLDLDRVGAPLGGNVRLSNSHSSIVLPVHVSDSVPRGTAVVPFNQPGADIRELIRRGESVVDVRIEAIA